METLQKETMMQNKFLVKTGKTIDEESGIKHVELEVVAGEYSGCKLYYNEIKFAENANPDGTLNMRFDYVITNGFKPKDVIDFNYFLGDRLLEVLEDMLGNDSDPEYCFKGGV